ncbi:CPBP family intramembrane glutamic endopeptidase [Fodinibius salsisoli]|uniref:CPBP family intramembrane metalloprotease n=1 Tax=Fodinibius salsisoli TaxID=2820877 RepID=A0ABT3PRU9_9BACT|nr:CPBP family intramembrane glutamic endopeptidase [Fodinibius salsisoli]MCW9708595.1 CPBP family intramembrane metalloprotease [Fodinibius salsisoli]
MKQDSDQQQSMQAAYQSWAERHGFANWVLALLWIIAAFFLFQFAALLVFTILVMTREGNIDPVAIYESMTDYLDLFFIGNSTGQILFLGLATWFFVRLHTSSEQRSAFMRFSAPSDTVRNLFLAVVLILSIQPTIWFLGWLNALIPMPEYFTNLQSSQMEMIENFLKSDHILWLTLFHVAVVPAICEEVLYRSYALRAFEKSWGIWPAIIVTGLLFGLYHVQLSNLLPLTGIGILLAYVTWVSKSVFPAMAAHFVNNGGSVLLGTYYPTSAFAEMTPETMPPLWGVVLSLVISGYIVYWMYNQHKKISTGGTSYV